MRELVYLIASLAAAAVMTALALIIRPESPFWKVILWGGIGVFAACACVIALDWLRPNGSAYFLGGMALGVALFVGCGTAFLFGPSFQGADLNKSRLAINETPIAVNCHFEMLPKVFGANDVIRVLNLFPTPVANGGGGLAEISNHSGKEWQWRITDEKELFGGRVGRCEITNYSMEPIFDFEMLVELAFYEAAPTPNQKDSISTGNIKLKRPWRISAQKIDAGPSNSFIFYIYNATFDHVVHVLFPQTAELRRLGEADMRTVKLDLLQTGSEIPMDFWPLRQSSNAQSIPTPPK